jgi:hypothetical protein
MTVNGQTLVTKGRKNYFLGLGRVMTVLSVGAFIDMVW